MSERELPESPLERAKRRYRPLQSVDELVGLERVRFSKKELAALRTKVGDGRD